MEGNRGVIIEGSNWYAVHVRSRHEFQVFERLKKSSIETFLPAVERLRRWKDRKKLISFPLFPCYLFVHTPDISNDRLTVLKTKGVVRFLGFDSYKPEPVPEEQIINLKKIIENKKSLDPYPYLKQGQMVRVKSGPLAGVEGILIEKIGMHMLVISVDLLQKSAALKIDISEVESV